MFYATPRAVGNLPKGLSKVASTTGHIFFEDPQGRPFNTALGYVEPVAIDQVQPRSVVDAITAPVKQVASTVTDAVSNIGSALRTAAFEPVSRPQVDVGPRGLEALAPNGLNPGGLDFYNSNQSGIAQDLQDALVGTSTEFGRNLGITSGYRSASHNQRVGGAKGSMHVQGKAADIDMTGMTSVEREQLVRELTQRGAGGFITYDQSPDMLHVDMRARPNGVDPHFMHNRSAANMSRAPDWFQAAAEFGGLRTPDQAPVPDAPPRNPDPLVAAPLGQIERAPLAPVPSSLMAAPAGVVERGNLAAAQPREPDPERFGPRGTVTTATADRLPERTDPLAALLSEGMLGRGRVTPPSFNSAMMTAPASGLPSQTLKAAPGTSLATNLPGIGPTNATYEDAPELTRRNPIANLASKAYDLVSGAVTPSAQASPSIPRAALGIGQTKAPSFTSARMTAPATSLPAQRMVAPAAQPSPAKQASVYQQAAASRAVPAPTNSMNSIPRGTMLQPPAPTAPANAALMSPSLMGPAQSLVPQGPQPLFTPAPAMPAVKPQVVTQPKIAQPVTTPTTARVKTPQQRIEDAFALAAPPAPKFTASDIYGGQVGTGTATGGNSVSRFENNPNTYVTNAFGVTTATGPNGNQMAVKGTPGPLSKASLSDPLAGMLGKMPSGKAIAGSLLGAALGNMVGGPLAGAVGAKLGSKLASGNIAQNSLLSKLMGGYSTNILGQRMTFANPTSGGPFPNAPDRPSGSDRSYDVSRGRDISPGASREIEAGRGGLY
nr:D-Ala-D-Ala carboxypeptidase family metallohydrolase [Aminobacter anthyllidis]